MIGFWDSKLCGAPPLLSLVVRRPSYIMSNLFSDIRPPEAVSMIAGACGLIFSLVSYRCAKAAEERSRRLEARAIENERKQFEVQIATEKDLALVEAHTVKSASDRRRWRIRTTKSDAECVGAAATVSECDNLLNSQVALLAPFEEIESMLLDITPETATHETLKAIKEYRTSLRRGVADEKLWDEQTSTVSDEATLWIRIQGAVSSA